MSQCFSIRSFLYLLFLTIVLIIYGLHVKRLLSHLSDVTSGSSRIASTDPLLIHDRHDLLFTFNNLHGIIPEQTLSDSSSEQRLNEVKGFISGQSLRPFVSMTVKIRSTIKNIQFLIDTGSPMTYLCKEVLDSYDITIFNTKTPFPVQINNRLILTSLSPAGSCFENLNILGMDYLLLYKARIILDFDEISINFMDD
ncbi:hypothetical protein RclHR1_00080036 [Rhizophagus clarus]|uniref:Peptidase A2 domain-containing protein n=1 Tax=Rhizophagus clarus TaxID=94130 RepID=A0A2Z6SMN9_9GLOM|nr:hypothetical protein RclHR1_00080036 [Rhizophagus clarus]GES89938.1 hypothetical protein GLOIN_2v1474342 [Rhizophagus clarus]